MRIIILVISILCVIQTVHTRVSKVHPDEKQKDFLHQTFKNLLNIEDDSDTAAPKRDITKSARAASKYMKTLFDRYRKHETGKESDVDKTVVRAITPKIGHYQDRESLLFDLDSISATEHLIKAELHFYRGKHPITRDGTVKKVRCFVVTPSKTNPSKPNETELPLVFDWDDLSESQNWAVFDAIKLVNSSIGERRSAPSNESSPHSFLAIIFAKGAKEIGPARVLNPRKSLRLHAPFLSISSRDSGQIRMNGNMDDVDEDEEESESEEDTSLESRRRKREVDSKYYEYYHPFETPFTTSPNDVGYQWGNGQTTTTHILQRGPSILRRTAQSSKTRKSKKRRGGSSLGRKLQDEYLEEVNAWAPMEEKGRGRKKKYGKVLKTKEDSPTTVVLLDGKQDEGSLTCQRNDLVVDFQDIGWGDYVIAPSSFEAHYCAGSCTFPVPASVNATNHAIVIDIMQKIGLHPQLPKPCCAPEKMDSLSLLYYDANGNVVLTTYPKMSVLSCACL